MKRGKISKKKRSGSFTLTKGNHFSKENVWYKVMLVGFARVSTRFLLVRCQRSFDAAVHTNSARWKHSIDTSKFPRLEEKDVVEQFVHGSGPGGQAVNKLSNCVMLCHTPTGVVVRCHESRLLHENRKMARRMLAEKVDEHLNGSMSVAAQKQRRDEQRAYKMSQKREKLRELRRQFKEREGLT